MGSSWHDRRNFLSKLSARKVSNAAAILASFYRSRLTKRPEISGLPVALAIEPTTSCNLRCPECPSGLRSFTRPTGMLNETMFRDTIDQLERTLAYLTFYFQGEPYLNPRFLEMVGYASRKGIYTTTSTNGHYLTEERARQTIASGLDRLIISIDGTSQETYESYRVGGSLEKVLDGAATIVRLKKQLRSRLPHVVFQFLVVKQNEHEIPDVHSLARQIGVNEVTLKTAQVYDFVHGSPFIPENPRYSRYERNRDGSYQIKNALLNHCWKMWHSCVITWDGRVVPCCFDKDAHYVLGNIAEMPFEKIWKGEAYRSFRKSLLTARNEIEICKNCTEGTNVWA